MNLFHVAFYLTRVNTKAFLTATEEAKAEGRYVNQNDGSTSGNLICKVKTSFSCFCCVVVLTFKTVTVIGSKLLLLLLSFGLHWHGNSKEAETEMEEKDIFELPRLFL